MRRVGSGVAVADGRGVLVMLCVGDAVTGGDVHDASSDNARTAAMKRT